MPRTQAYPLTLKDTFLEFTLPSGDPPDVAPAGRARLRYNPDGPALMLSVDGGAYAELESSGAGGDTLTIGGDVTLTRLAAGVLGVPSVRHADGTAAAPSVAFTSDPDTGLYLSAANELSVATAGVQRWKVDASGRLANTAVTAATYTIDTRTDVDDTIGGSFRLRNLSNTSGAAVVIQLVSATGGGSFGHYPAAHTSVSSAFQDCMVMRADSDSAALLFAAQSAGQEIRFRVATTGQVLMLKTGLITLADAVDLVFGTGTGTKIGTAATQKIGAYGNTPVVRPAAYTQTYSTATRTHANPTAAVLTMADGAGTNDNTIGAITADASVIAAFQEVVDEINKAIADIANVKQVVNQALDDDQLIGWKS